MECPPFFFQNTANMFGCCRVCPGNPLHFRPIHNRGPALEFGGDYGLQLIRAGRRGFHSVVHAGVTATAAPFEIKPFALMLGTVARSSARKGPYSRPSTPANRQTGCKNLRTVDTTMLTTSLQPGESLSRGAFTTLQPFF